MAGFRNSALDGCALSLRCRATALTLRAGLHSLRSSLDGCALPGLHSLRSSLDGCALPGLHSLRSSRGVTLIELMVVLAILGTAMALVGPSIQKGVERFTLDSTGRQLVSAFRMARHEARLGQREVLGKLSGEEFVLLRGEQRLKGIKLPGNIKVKDEQEITYSFLASGQILGPERLQLISGGRYHGVLILGPPPGTVRFEMKR